MVKKKPGDYFERQGVTNRPKMELDGLTMQILHMILRSADCFFKTCVHLAAGVSSWTESKVDPSYKFLVAEKQNIQTEILNGTGS